jgi:glycosyltransferase involved in cell wall biosynthesis/2-polyprenyl-3-methyl-5-hydroxy-6-metoxy-1,4-benzoquinol methylase
MQDLDIYILCPGMPFQGDTLDKKSLGGSETAALCMARELAKLGHHVAMFNNNERPGVYDGVQYRPLHEWDACARADLFDVAIVQRAPMAFANRLSSRLNYLWVHDLALMSQKQATNGSMWNVNKIITVSDFHTKQYQQVYGLPDDAFLTSRNGIDLERFELGNPKRNRKKIIYGARPERGLDVMLDDIMPKLLQRDPEIELYICTYDNQAPHMADFYNYLKGRAQRFGKNVKMLGALTKPELYLHYATAGVYVYPTPSPTAKNFREVSCITAMECMASGLPIVTTHIGALPETINPDAGKLFDLGPAYADHFCEAVISYIKDDAKWEAASNAGRAHARELGWDGVARQWAQSFENEFDRVGGSGITKALHFIRRSDIIAAKEAIKEDETPRAEEIKNHINENWGMLIESDTSLRELNEKIGAGHTDVFHMSLQEPRFRHARAWLESHPESKRILDYGCAHGSYAIGLAEQTGRHITGIDIDGNSIKLAEKWRNDPERCKNPERVKFMQGTHEIDLSAEPKFDTLFAMEVLEHVPRPWEVIDSVERWVKKGGKALITVPFGPWEYMSYRSYPYRQHIWEFDLHDLRDIFGKKKGFNVQTMPYMYCQEMGEPVGWHIIEYEVTGAPCGEIDMARKLRYQAPRQTLSACIIAGPNSEDTLHWSLKSLSHVCDEIVIGDCGMSPEAKRIATMHVGYGVPLRFVEASSPVENGFETPRNQALEHCTGDFIIWIDTDEKVLNQENLHKYLRHNIFDGYSIRQHHFAVDTRFDPDMPVRVFRRVANDGTPMRWFGMIHEHPERRLNEGPGMVIAIGDVNIPHLGYLQEDIRRHRFDRNRPLLNKDIETYPDRILQKHFIIRDTTLEAQYIIEQAQSQRREPTMAERAAIVERCEKVIALWREHFMGRDNYLGAQSLNYYSTCCQILGRGFNVAYQIDAASDNPNLREPSMVRFATPEDARTELGKLINSSVAPFETEYQ